MGVKFGMAEGTEGPLLHAKFHPHRYNVSPLRGEKPQNRPLSKLNTGRFALRAMLPVIIDCHIAADSKAKLKCCRKRKMIIEITSIASSKWLFTVNLPLLLVQVNNLQFTCFQLCKLFECLWVRAVSCTRPWNVAKIAAKWQSHLEVHAPCRQTWSHPWHLNFWIGVASIWRP